MLFRLTVMVMVLTFVQDTIHLSRLPSAPHDHAYHAVVAGKGKIFTLGGTDDSVDCFDPATNRWSTIAKMPSHRDFCGAAEDAETITVMGGTDVGGSVYVDQTIVLDTRTGKWKQRPNMITPRNRLAVVALKHQFYTIGGMKAAGNGTVNSADIERYDPDTRQWLRLEPMPTPRHGLAAVVVNDRILAIGGMGADNTPGAGRNGTLSTVEEYDPTTNRWRKRANMPTPRGFLGAVAVGGKVYAIGGHYDTRTLECYDPSTDKWTKLPDLELGFTRFGSVRLGSSIYLVGGEEDLRGLMRLDPK